MMSRREKLLVRPWQLRRYNNHKKKVLNAVSIVDFGPPPQRVHVMIKSKKLQKEKERQMKIEEDNFKLLQNLSSIMSKKRVDNYWEVELPKFLGRVGIYHKTRPPTPFEGITPQIITPVITGSRKSKCLACTPQPEPLAVIPEERIPWAPPKKTLTRRQSVSAVVPTVSDFDFTHNKKDLKIPLKYEKTFLRSKNFLTKGEIKSEPVLICKNSKMPYGPTKNLKETEVEQKIVVRQGSFQIAVNIRPFAEVKLVRGKNEKYLQKGFCECKNTSLKKKIGTINN